MSSLPETLKSILSSASISNEIGTAFMSLASTIEQLRAKTNETAKEVELVRKLARTCWLMVFNMPLQFGVGKGQSLQNLLEKLGYGKPLFDHDRDLLASDMVYVNRNGSTCNMAFFVAQRHHDYLLSAPFQKKILQYNKELERGSWVSFGRVLTPTERADFEMAQALKRLLISKMKAKKLEDPSYSVLFVLVDKSTLRLRIDKTYFTLEEASLRYGINVDEIIAEKTRYHEANPVIAEKRKGNKRKGENNSVAPSSKIQKL
ncbi:hypothetical protein ANCCAN_27003 [Ancylostoma caninum]|uniref:Uncharacterized protein n=1 Tax=Ancylostoma caninum TaxID=29170 RepID=A0A368F552_ANCCA|nr:hypothetical protein ANCCAN_27003 [Ancylostoma caninum]